MTSPFGLISEERPCALYISCSTTVQRFLTVLEISVQVSFRGQPVTPKRGHTGTKWKVHIVQNFILNYFCFIMHCKIFLVFEILVVKDLRFLPLKSIITSHITLITVWLDPERWAEQFLFYNFQPNINSLKDIVQKLWTLLGPLAWYQNKGPVILYISCSTSVQKILTVLEISEQVSFRGQPVTP